jgi:hypothetical protein
MMFQHFLKSRPDAVEELLNIGGEKPANSANTESIHLSEFARVNDEATLAQLVVKTVE